jgi:hypothetical protein
MREERSLQIEVAVKSRQKRTAGQARKEKPEAVPPARIPRIARLMALAIKFQDMVDRGEVRDYADLARLGLVSRARLTQIMNLLLLAPDIQEALLFQRGKQCGPPEREHRMLVGLPLWDDQRRSIARNTANT